jgi:hypothetical protein
LPQATKLMSEKSAGPGVATRCRRRQKPRFLPPETKLMSEKAPQATFSK